VFELCSATSLISDVGTILTAVRVPVNLLFGVASTQLPISLLLVASDMFACAIFPLVILPTPTAQHAATVFFAMQSTIFYTMIPVQSQQFSPPELFGSLLGLVNGFLGVLQFVVVPIEDSIAASLGASERQTFIGEEAVWITLVIIFASFDYYWRWRVPPPRLGMVNMATVRAAQ
jgi:hypothetical protein